MLLALVAAFWLADAAPPATGDPVSALIVYGPLGIFAVIGILFVRQQFDRVSKDRDEWAARYIALSEQTTKEFVPAAVKFVETGERLLRLADVLQDRLDRR